MFEPNSFPNSMALANTSEINSLNQIAPRRGLGDLSFDGTGVFGTGLFGGASWGPAEWIAVLLGGGLVASSLGLLGGRKGSNSGRRRKLQLAKAQYELQRAQA